MLAGLCTGPRAARSRERVVTVYAAASLADAFNAVKAEFERSDPGWRIRLNFGASSQLRTQIEQGAPADVFASADYAQMGPLAREGLIHAPVILARNRLTVVVPNANPGRVGKAEHLARPGLRIVTTAESVPIGRYTRQLLENLEKTRGYPPDFARRVSANVVSREANVRSVLAKVELGEADAAIVYESDAKSSRRSRAIPVPASANVTAEYPIAVVKAARSPVGAERFIRFARGKAGARILRRYGFR
jgi:molybdate transport system substrate-binding protein